MVQYVNAVIPVRCTNVVLFHSMFVLNIGCVLIFFLQLLRRTVRLLYADLIYIQLGPDTDYSATGIYVYVQCGTRAQYFNGKNSFDGVMYADCCK